MRVRISGTINFFDERTYILSNPINIYILTQ
jgi:hypothetical protein